MPNIDVACTLTRSVRDASDVTRAVPFEKIARALLPKNYTLSVALVGDARAKQLNRAYKKKNYPANVLSFPLGKNEGEIILNVRKAEREARALRARASHRIAHLYIHGILHLLGIKHCPAMDKKEKETLKRFGFAS